MLGPVVIVASTKHPTDSPLAPSVSARVGSLEHLEHLEPSSRVAEPDVSRPIFLHSLWRSGSTYVWSRFRTAKDVYCYYEPLHDGLHKLTADRISRTTPDAVAANGHPVLRKPYYAEFEPLLGGGRGVRHFRRRFAYHRFALAPDAEDAPLEAYFHGLINHAAAMGQRPVLGVNRSDLRVGWMRRKFKPFSIIVEREPADIFASYLSQMRRGNSYYFEKLLLIAELNADSRLFQYPASQAPTRNWFERAFVRPKDFYRKVAEAAPLSRLYAITFHAWIVQLLHGLSHGDLVMDFSLADDKAYPRRLSALVEAGCGLRVDFEDLKVAGPSMPTGLDNQAAIEAEVLERLPLSALEPFIDRALAYVADWASFRRGKRRWSARCYSRTRARRVAF